MCAYTHKAFRLNELLWPCGIWEGRACYSAYIQRINSRYSTSILCCMQDLTYVCRRVPFHFASGMCWQQTFVPFHEHRKISTQTVLGQAEVECWQPEKQTSFGRPASPRDSDREQPSLCLPQACSPSEPSTN